MAEIFDDKKQLVSRIRRIRGQLNAVEKAVENEAECGAVLNTMAACKGAVDSLMVELIEDYVRNHLAGPSRRIKAKALDELSAVLKRYMK